MSDKITLDGVTLDVDSVRKALEEYDAKLKQGEIDWKRVVDEGYLCHFHHSASEQQQQVIQKLIAYHPRTTFAFRAGNGAPFPYCEILRLPNIIQPHFGCEGMPEGISAEDKVTIHLRGYSMPQCWEKVDRLCWEHLGQPTDIMAYIVHRPLGG